ncbi:MAG: class I SAM-dependent methyltransferase [Rhodospirillaceae bacterium]
MTGPFPCPYCGGPSVLHVAAADINRRVSERVYHLQRCQACALMFVRDPPPDLGPYYTGDYHVRPASAEELAPHLEGQRFKIEIVRRFKAGGRLLEIGPSIGIFCRLAQQAGFAVSAIEMDPDCVRFLTETLGVRAIQSADAAAILAEAPETYDAICLWHSIEHMAAPWTVLERAIARLNPGGMLVVAAPNPLSWQARLMKAAWPHYDLPRHLFELPPDWLERFARERGLAPELITTRDPGSLYWNRFSWSMLLQSRLRLPGARRYLWHLGALIGHLLSPLEGREGNGAAYTAVFRKPA